MCNNDFFLKKKQLKFEYLQVIYLFISLLIHFSILIYDILDTQSHRQAPQK